MPEQNLCVLIDFENIAAGTEKEGHGRFNIRAVLHRLKDKGRILVTRAYGDWGRFAKFKQSLLEQGVQMMELTSYRGQDKNRADIALVVDAMELAFTRDYLHTYVLLSGDSDFTPLVMRLKELNKRVIGIGTRGSTSRLLAESCDEFIFYENIKRDKDYNPTSRGRSRSHSSPAPTHSSSSSNGSSGSALNSSGLSKHEAFALVVETLEGLQKEDAGPVLAGLLKQSVQRKEPTFDESDYGYSGFARFLEGAQKKGLLTLLKDNKSGGYRVDLLSTDAVEPPKDSPDDPSLPELPEAAARLREVLDEAGFNPVTHFMRHTVVHELVDHVQERQKRKKRNTLMYVHGDIARRCRKTDPYVPAPYVSAVLNALQAAGEFRHADGNPVRSSSAQFTLNKDAEELLQELRHFYLRTLIVKGEDVNNSEALSYLLWGDDKHRREIEELSAWLQHEHSERSAGEATSSEAAPTEGEAPSEAAPTEGEAGAPAVVADAPSAEETTEEEGSSRRRGRRRGRRRRRDTDAPASEDAVAAAPPAVAATPEEVVLSTGLSAAPPAHSGVLEAEALLTIA